MIVARSSCFAVSSSNNEMMIVGGINEEIEPEGTLKLVEIAQIFFPIS